jgi:2-methylisocitrate lyase-like PEP mutase family enzyme
MDQREKGRRFRQLHESGLFVMPNAWSPGSARWLARAAFEALGTTSAGIAFEHGYRDSDPRFGRDRALECARAIVAAVDIPVSADLEAGYGSTAKEVAETFRLSVEAGLVGGSIEDISAYPETGNPPLFAAEAAAERVRAAREAIDATGMPYVLTARSECYLVRHPQPFEEALRRIRLYREAGADCVYVPGMKDSDEIARLVRESGAPVNQLMGMAGIGLSLDELARLGVRRVSTGGSIARACFATIDAVAAEIRTRGTFGYTAGAVPQAALDEFFRDAGPPG